MNVHTPRYKDLPTPERLLIDTAYEAMERAYCPYSTFAVGAAVCGVDGSIVSGINVETAAYEVVHAEAHALSQAQARKLGAIDSIAIVTSSHANGPEDIYGPCGSCRQRILEFAERDGKDILVLSTTVDRTWVLRAPISALLPFAFGPAALKGTMRNRSRVIGE